MEEHRGEEEVSVKEEGAPEVQQSYPSFLLGRLRPEGSERPRVVKQPNCSCLEEATFIGYLKLLFLTIFILAAINLMMFELLLTHDRSPYEPSTWDYIFNQTWLFGHFQIGRRGIVLLAVFAAAVVVSVFVKKLTTKSAGSAAQRRGRVQTISALIQQV